MVGPFWHIDPTLNGKGGGVFGLARLAHHMMEAWMADDTLNANQKVATWHENEKEAGTSHTLEDLCGVHKLVRRVLSCSFVFR